MKARLDPHSKYRELLAARLDRPLTRAENRSVVAHLKSCVECRQVERDYLDQRSLLRAMSRPIPPRDLWARTSTSLDREVARWSYRYPRFGRRRVPLGDKRSNSGAPSALATAVAALGVVTVLAVLQLGPTLRPQPSSYSGIDSGDAPAATAAGALRPTPFAIPPQPLAVWAAGVSDFAVYETQVTQVCPPSAFDCFDDERIVRRSVALSSNIHPENVALSPMGDQLAVVGSDLDRDFIGVVMLQNRNQPISEPPTPPRTPERSPDRIPDKTPDGHETAPPPTATATVEPSPSENPVDTSPPSDVPSADPGSSSPVATTVPETPTLDPTPDGSATVEPVPTPEAPTETPAATAQGTPTPPMSAVPGLTVLSILENVHTAGAPPAWSRDGALLAFSAMPADGRHGPDVYVWAPGDDQAHAVTSDHASFFASWSGKRIVVSRLDDDDGKSDSLETRTVVIDPMTLEERLVVGPEMWLPVVDSQRSHAVVWNGELDRVGNLPVGRAGALYLVDWAALNPFAEVASPSETAQPTTAPVDAGPEANAEGSAVKLIALDPSRDPQANPVLDWQVRWSADGRVLGIWEAEPGASWGKLEVLTFDRDTELFDFQNPLVPRQLAKRGFSLGDDRVAWVGAPEPGSEGDLQIQTWGEDGVGELRIKSVNVEELVPAF